ncbi:MAG: hypothetical protein R3C09_08270 [Pirellulaceae bacterium]
MHNTNEIKDRRIEQFRQLLAKMHDRAHNEAEGACYIRFDESDKDNSSQPAALEAIRSPAVELVTSVSSSLDSPHHFPFTNCGDSADQFGGPIDGFSTDAWRPSNRDCPRFVQFAALEFSLQIDIPKSVLFQAESQRLFRDRSGLFYLHERPQHVTSRNEIERFDPALKFYIYGDERSAAEDVGYLGMQIKLGELFQRR